MKRMPWGCSWCCRQTPSNEGHFHSLASCRKLSLEGRCWWSLPCFGNDLWISHRSGGCFKVVLEIRSLLQDSLWPLAVQMVEREFFLTERISSGGCSRVVLKIVFCKIHFAHWLCKSLDARRMCAGNLPIIVYRPWRQLIVSTFYVAY